MGDTTAEDTAFCIRWLVLPAGLDLIKYKSGKKIFVLHRSYSTSKLNVQTSIRICFLAVMVVHNLYFRCFWEIEAGRSLIYVVNSRTAWAT